MADVKLTIKQLKFVEEYLVDLNATQAALRAGYSKKSAPVIGWENLRKPLIFAKIEAARKKWQDRVHITQDQVLNELAKLGFANMDDYVRVGPDGLPIPDFGSLTRDQKAALSEVTVDTVGAGRMAVKKDGNVEHQEVTRVKFKLHDKRASLVDIGKHIGMFTTNINLMGGVEVKKITRTVVRPKPK